MLQVDQRFEIEKSQFRGLDETHLHIFPWVEHCLTGPVWHAEVLPSPSADGGQYWRRFLATSIDDVVHIFMKGRWQQIRLYAVLPAYMSKGSCPTFVRCASLWRCRVLGAHESSPWLFETDQGSYLEPTSGLELADIVPVSEYWRDAELLDSADY